jgi:hypothetical protein
MGDAEKYSYLKSTGYRDVKVEGSHWFKISEDKAVGLGFLKGYVASPEDMNKLCDAIGRYIDFMASRPPVNPDEEWKMLT